MVSPGSVQREKHSWAQGPSTRLGRGQRSASREELGAFQTEEGAGQAQLFRTSSQVPSTAFPGPATRVRRGWGKELGEGSSQSLTQREMCTRAPPHEGLHTQMDTHSPYTDRNTQTLHALTNAGMDSHAQTHTFKHRLRYIRRHIFTNTHTYVYTHTHDIPHSHTRGNDPHLCRQPPTLSPNRPHTCRPLCP